MDFLVRIMEIIGIVAFAASGALTGLKKNMDLLGVAVLGLITSVGGGFIRDLTLGITPPGVLRDPTYALIALAVSVLLFIPAMHKLLTRRAAFYDKVLLVMDAIGLGLFSTVGIQIAKSQNADYSVFLYVFVGVITGVGGGILRDMMSGSTPFIFVKHIYASASIVGSSACTLLWPLTGSFAAMLTGSAIIIVIRLLSAHFKWNLPRAAL